MTILIEYNVYPRRSRYVWLGCLVTKPLMLGLDYTHQPAHLLKVLLKSSEVVDILSGKARS